MGTVKDEARKVIDTLPDNVTWGDIVYELHVREKIAAGLKDADEGRVISHEEMKKHFGIHG